ncbi:hypothetical protein [Leisingera sp. JC1]|uniref:hypothetical protein n=1 Tax=Leisingera sp. JC1 TaxID=1855282 RepID=UPI0020C7BD08|nr:hypothetical protein [Leisingera sp. JC1]
MQEHHRRPALPSVRQGQVVCAAVNPARHFPAALRVLRRRDCRHSQQRRGQQHQALFQHLPLLSPARALP